MDELNETINQIVDLVLPEPPKPTVIVTDHQQALEMLDFGTLQPTDLVSASIAKAYHDRLKLANETIALKQSKIDSLIEGNREWQRKIAEILGLVRQMFIDHDLVEQCSEEIEELVEAGMKPMVSDYSYTVTMTIDLSGQVIGVPFGVDEDEVKQAIEEAVADFFHFRNEQSIDVEGHPVDVTVDVDDTNVTYSWVAED